MAGEEFCRPIWRKCMKSSLTVDELLSKKLMVLEAFFERQCKETKLIKSHSKIHLFAISIKCSEDLGVAEQIKLRTKLASDRLNKDIGWNSVNSKKRWNKLLHTNKFLVLMFPKSFNDKQNPCIWLMECQQLVRAKPACKKSKVWESRSVGMECRVNN